MSAGEAGVLLIAQELWPRIASRGEWLHMWENFPGWKHGQGGRCFIEISDFSIQHMHALIQGKSVQMETEKEKVM